MKRCELCGAENPDDGESCSRCGFEFRREITSDSRDGALLDRHSGKPVKAINRDLRNQRSRMTAYLENLGAKDLSLEETVTLINEALSFLQVPVEMGIEDVLTFDGEEQRFILLIADTQERVDRDAGRPAGNAATYIRLGNALQALGQRDRAMAMLDSALLLDRRNRDALLAKAMFLLAAKRYGPARKCLEKLMSEGDDGRARCLVELIDQLDGPQP